MATIGDHLRKAWRNYVAPSAEDIKVGKKEEKLAYPPDASPEYKHDFLKKELSMQECRSTAQQCPAFMKGARKKAMDSIRAWFELQSQNPKTVPVKADLQLLKAFERRAQFKKKWEEAKIAAFIYGDGYLLITYENDEKTELHDPPSKIKVNDESVFVAPWKVKVLNSEFIKEIDFYPSEKEKYQKLFTKHFHYEDSKNNKDDWIHPDRIIHFTVDKLPHKEFGNSKINLLRNVIKSMINVDISCGEILAWFAHGTYDIEDEDIDDDKRKMWEKIAKKHPGVWIHGSREHIKAINPTAIDPKPFYDYIVFKVASAFRMPTHVLTGIQVGKVTGAEVGMGDYVKDVKDDQEFEYTPLIEILYERILKAKGRKWKYDIIWNAIYIDELAEAEILLKRVEAATLAMNGQRGAGGFINPKESRMIFNKGQIELDTENIPTDIPKPQKPESPSNTSDDDDDDDGKDKDKDKNKEYLKKQSEKNLYNYQLDVSQKAMIAKRKLQAAKERLLGEKQDGNTKSTN